MRWNGWRKRLDPSAEEPAAQPENTLLRKITWRRFMREVGFTELEHYYRPAGLPREQQPWLASVWRK